MLLLPTTLFFFSWTLGAYAADNGTSGTACSQSDQRLEFGSYQFQSDCDPTNFCNSTGVCTPKGCRKDEFPFGYSSPDDFPPKCPTGSFCPDEGDACQPDLPVGSACQFNRDDECQGPPDFRELADHTGFGLNVNGSVCLNNVCMYSNVTVGLPCVVQNTAFITYTATTEYTDIVSRDNCKVGLYCDSQQLVCMQTKDLGASCDADKECSTYNCNISGVCGKSADTPEHVASWVYVVVGVGIVLAVVGTFVGMFFWHRKERDAERGRRLQYWQEQNAFRQNIMQMQETARDSLLLYNNGSQRSTMYGPGSEDSQQPMLHSATKSSALRYQVSDDGMDDGEDALVMNDRKDNHF